MRFNELNSMTLDELWSLHEELVPLLLDRISKEKALLDGRLRILGITSEVETPRDAPSVVPKYRNPDRPSETWSGRGRKPAWLTAQLRQGRKLGDFRF